mgnify:CR=1 FL=1
MFVRSHSIPPSELTDDDPFNRGLEDRSVNAYTSSHIFSRVSTVVAQSPDKKNARPEAGAGAIFAQINSNP